jgi:hypothetical protein
VVQIRSDVISAVFVSPIFPGGTPGPSLPKSICFIVFRVGRLLGTNHVNGNNMLCQPVV